MPEPHRFPIRVYYEDTDAAGIVYYANYLKFAERGRSEFLRAHGFDHARLQQEDGLVFAVRRCCADYLRPAQLDDAVIVETTITAVSGARIEMHQSIHKDDTILCDLTVTLVCVAQSGRAVRIPVGVREAFHDNGDANLGK